MQKFKLTLGILGLLLSFVTMGEDNYLYKENGKPELSGGTYTARISAKKAIVYADENMLSPIGYIANGKAIKVGNPRRINRDLVPLIVYGRLAFIEIKDIQYEDSSDEEFKIKKGAPLEHNFDLNLERHDNIRENNSMFFSAHTFTAGSDVKNAFLYYEGEEKSNFLGVEAQFLHRLSTAKYFWGIDFGYSKISAGGSSLSFFTSGLAVGYTFVKNSFMALDVYGSLDFSLGTSLKIDVEDYQEPGGGFIWGVQGNARLLLYPDNKFHPFIAGGFRHYKVKGYETLRDSQGQSIAGIESILGVNAMIGLGMEFR